MPFIQIALNQLIAPFFKLYFSLYLVNSLYDSLYKGDSDQVLNSQ